ncbi:hypothetical protein [Phenylobacterium sp.]|uniref:hypothetical protein n=1 Tax=Phenylobacterium sp. TaxID=1871053 RepID=UPI0025CDB3B3|nr:hypothetical protein [Phenylobacterium sp.]
MERAARPPTVEFCQPLKGDAPACAPLELVEGVTFTDHVEMDGKRFRDCHFKGAVLHISGAAPFVLENTAISSPELHFSGGAASVLTLLRSLAASSGEHLAGVKALLQMSGA